ncbi:MAG: TspO/MBR family protein [Chlamydiota bacterium]
MNKFTKGFYLLLALVLCYSVEWTASLFTQSSVDTWYKTLIKPSWNPPNIAFPIVWTILYTMIALSFWLILSEPKARHPKPFVAFFLQLFLNFTWSLAFFYLQSPLLGLVNIIFLLVAILWNIREFSKYSLTASRLLYPYFLWVAYAVTLNAAIWYLNM